MPRGRRRANATRVAPAQHTAPIWSQTTNSNSTLTRSFGVVRNRENLNTYISFDELSFNFLTVFKVANGLLGMSMEDFQMTTRKHELSPTETFYNQWITMMLKFVSKNNKFFLEMAWAFLNFIFLQPTLYNTTLVIFRNAR